MTTILSARQLTGQDQDHLTALPDGHLLQAAAARAFIDLQTAARCAGFELAIASSFRSCERQLAIWNGKARGERPVHDDDGRAVSLAPLSPQQQLHAIMRYSAIPGTSRHHWGTDLDVFDAAALPPGYRLQLSPQEVAPGGIFDALHQWLDERMASGESRGFFRPYATDRGGVAPERWHLSYAPLAQDCAGRLTQAVLEACWDACPTLALREEITADWRQLEARYVAVANDWCPRGNT